MRSRYEIMRSVGGGSKELQFEQQQKGTFQRCLIDILTTKREPVICRIERFHSCGQHLCNLEQKKVFFT